ncbi:MAG: LysR family transcriptional regulator [Hyphomicrobiaceae bacterium]|nr:LysR family transcriptional regulator [Hyphomicrobiaceae bacterium]
MNWNTVSFDWNQARAFLVTAEEGSLSAAARALGLTQPTLGRQVTALEESLGVTLFERVGRSLELTQPGLELLDHVRGMGEAAGRFSLAASGQSQTIEGHVSITATNMMATFHLPPVFKKIRDMAPEIELEILASSEVRDLHRREADIAIRHGRPEHPELIARRVGETTAHLYAASEHLDAIGRPRDPQDIADADFIGFGDPTEYLSYLTALGLPLTRDNFKTTTNSGTVILALMRQGFGMSVLTKQDADLAPDIEQVLPDLEPIPVPIWLVTHRELHTSRRIRLVFDLLAEEIARLG